MTQEANALHAPPNAAALIESLRALGYHLPDAIADLVDNSVSAAARTVRVEYNADPGAGWVAIIDDGGGMTEERLHRAMHLGAEGPLANRGPSDLGRFGMGLKTASFSQARKMTVLTRSTDGTSACRSWDLDLVAKRGDWYMSDEVDAHLLDVAEQLQLTVPGTLVLWRDLDRCGYGRVLTDGMARVREHLGAVFGRYLQDGRLRLTVGGQPVVGWDPFMIGHPATQDLGSEHIEGGSSTTKVTPYVLPHPSRLTEGDSRLAAGPGGWSSHQGFYIYRGDRLLTLGGWLGLSGLRRSQQCQLARIAVDITTEDDHNWQVDIRKARVSPPSAVRERLRDIAVLARTRSEQIFRHRGAVLTPRGRAGDNTLTFVWQQRSRRGQIGYRINREHPLIDAALSAQNATAVETVLQLIEETIPIGLIATEASATPDRMPQAPLEKAEQNEIVALFQAAVASLPHDPGTRNAIISALRSTEPFNRFPEILADIVDIEGAGGAH